MLDIGEARKELVIFGDKLLLPPCTTHNDRLCYKQQQDLHCDECC